MYIIVASIVSLHRGINTAQAFQGALVSVNSLKQSNSCRNSSFVKSVWGCDPTNKPQRGGLPLPNRVKYKNTQEVARDGLDII